VSEALKTEERTYSRSCSWSVFALCTGFTSLARRGGEGKEGGDEEGIPERGGGGGGGGGGGRVNAKKEAGPCVVAVPCQFLF
jgi:hypothetical protein